MGHVIRMFNWSVLIAFILALGCSQEKTGNPLPQEIQSLELLKSTSGPQAAAMIARLHGKQVASTENYIGHYGSGASHIMLYVSGFQSADEAQNLLSDMSDRIGTGSSGFTNHQQSNINDQIIHSVIGQGRVHYFFAKENYLYWLAIVPDMARAGLAQLLKVDVKKIPAVDSQ